MDYISSIFLCYWSVFFLTGSFPVTNGFCYVLTLLIGENFYNRRRVQNFTFNERMFVITIFHLCVHFITINMNEYGMFWPALLGSTLNGINVSNLINMY